MGCGTPNAFPTVEPTFAGKPTILTAGPGIIIEDFSDADAYRFTISASVYAALVATLSMAARSGGLQQSNPVLKGVIIDEVELDWTYNKAIASQALTNTGGLTAPTLVAADAAYEYISQAIGSDITFTLSGNDGGGQPGSLDTDQKSILFGNNMILGTTTNFNSLSVASFITAIAAFTRVVKTSRPHTYFATGIANQHHYVVYPKAWGLATFTKGIFEGGYVRLKNVGGTLKQELIGGDVEIDISMTNQEGFAEAYYVYMTLYDNQADAVTPFIIS